MPAIDTIRLRRGTAAEWAAANPVLKLGEPGHDRTNNLFKIGDGTTTWSGLPITGGGGAQGPIGPQGIQGNPGAPGAPGAGAYAPESKTWAPTTWKRESRPRLMVGSAQAQFVSGQMIVAALPIGAGETITKLGYCVAAQQTSGLTGCWAALYDPALNLVGVTANDTSAASPATGVRGLDLVTPYVAPADGMHFVCWVFTGAPGGIFHVRMSGLNPTFSPFLDGPMLSFVGPTGLTVPSSAPASLAAHAAGAGQPSAVPYLLVG